MNGVDHFNKTSLNFWLPLGFDIYCLCLQEVKNTAETGSCILSHLQSQSTDEHPVEYIEYMHNVTLVEPQKKSRRKLVTYIYVHTTLREESVFHRRKLSTLLFETHKPYVSAGAVFVDFKVFDTKVRLVNTLLTKGPGPYARSQRQKEISQLNKEIQKNAFIDQVLLMGDFSFSVANTDGSKLNDMISVINEPTGWTAERFRPFLEGHDEKSEMLPLQHFNELEITHAPTSRRIPRRLDPKSISRLDVAEIFHEDFELDRLYNYTTADLPCYPDRIFYRSEEPHLQHCFVGFKQGTCEGVLLNDRVPVYATFRLGSKELASEPAIQRLKSGEELRKIRSEYHANRRGIFLKKKKKNPAIHFKNTRVFEEITTKVSDIPIKTSLSQRLRKTRPKTIISPKQQAAPKLEAKNEVVKEQLDEFAYPSDRVTFANFGASEPNLRKDPITRQPSDVLHWDNNPNVDAFRKAPMEPVNENDLDSDPGFIQSEPFRRTPAERKKSRISLARNKPKSPSVSGFVLDIAPPPPIDADLLAIWKVEDEELQKTLRRPRNSKRKIRKSKSKRRAPQVLKRETKDSDLNLNLEANELEIESKGKQLKLIVDRLMKTASKLEIKEEPLSVSPPPAQDFKDEEDLLPQMCQMRSLRSSGFGTNISEYGDLDIDSDDGIF